MIGEAQSETTHRVVSNLYNNLENMGGAHAPGAPPVATPMLLRVRLRIILVLVGSTVTVLADSNIHRSRYFQ